VADGMARGIVSFVNAASIDAPRTIEALKSRLPPYMLPNRIIALNAIPLSANGKVDRKALRQLLDTQAP
jgi:non-ribosomal peptide synthetase component E (peptide arylation enzyme)